MIEIRRISPNVYDVFQGTQWSTHSRVKQTRHGVFVVSGEKLGHAFLKTLHSILDPRMPINHGQPLQQTLTNCQALANNGM